MEDKTLLTVLEGIQNSRVKLVEITGQMHARMEANDLALAKMVADTSARSLITTKRRRGFFSTSLTSQPERNT